LLANIYMNRFLKHWRLTGCGEAFRAHVVAYADDFVILSRGCAAEALAWTKAAMTKLGLTINEAKTSLRDARQERFDFLGYSFGPHYPYNSGVRRCMSVSPSKKSVQRLKTKVRELLVPGNNASWPEVRDELNRSYGAGRATSVWGRLSRPSAASTTMSASACVPSSPDGTRWQGAAIVGSRGMRSIGTRRAVSGTPAKTCPL
jgi:hypothetical protein